jgi:3'(2'), 5'-bisphosphate nucleotidase
VSWEFVAELERLAQDAGEQILEIYQREFVVQYKSPGDPVTEADAAANTLIVAGLRDRFPHAAIVAEESDPATFADYRAKGEVFFVDPLDGTREFVARNGQFVVMIGYAEQGQARVGVIYSPTRRTTWSGAVGLGARRTLEGKGPQAIAVGQKHSWASAQALCSRSHASVEVARALAALGVGRVTKVGSAGLKGAKVADGSADLYVSLGVSGKYWDACALDALVHAAGGRVTDARGQTLDYNAPGLSLDHGLVVANRTLHALAVDSLAASASESPADEADDT